MSLVRVVKVSNEQLEDLEDEISNEDLEDLDIESYDKDLDQDLKSQFSDFDNSEEMYQAEDL